MTMSNAEIEPKTQRKSNIKTKQVFKVSPLKKSSCRVPPHRCPPVDWLIKIFLIRGPSYRFPPSAYPLTGLLHQSPPFTEVLQGVSLYWCPPVDFPHSGFLYQSAPVKVSSIRVPSYRFPPLECPLTEVLQQSVPSQCPPLDWVYIDFLNQSATI